MNIAYPKEYIKQNRILFKFLFPIIFLRRLYLKLKAMPFKKFYEFIFDLVESGSLIVRVSSFKGIFEIDIRSNILKQILKDKRYEPILVELVKKYVDPQKDVLDIGANIGLFTILFSKIVSANNKVLAVEPTPLALHYLRRNVKRNNCDKAVIIFEGAATNKKALVRINIIPGMEEYSSLAEIVHPAVVGKITDSIEVEGHPIDNIVEKFSLTPGFIKIDAEGSEYKVVSGAVNTLKKHRPVILSELSDTLLSCSDESSEKVITLLQENGYKVFNAEAPALPIKFPFIGEIIALPAETSINL
jgi:FkbM family methyltransferase